MACLIQAEVNWIRISTTGELIPSQQEWPPPPRRLCRSRIDRIIGVVEVDITARTVKHRSYGNSFRSSNAIAVRNHSAGGTGGSTLNARYCGDVWRIDGVRRRPDRAGRRAHRVYLDVGKTGVIVSA